MMESARADGKSVPSLASRALLVGKTIERRWRIARSIEPRRVFPFRGSGKPTDETVLQIRGRGFVVQTRAWVKSQQICQRQAPQKSWFTAVW
jgi:hypothetical protein